MSLSQQLLEHASDTPPPAPTPRPIRPIRPIPGTGGGLFSFAGSNPAATGSKPLFGSGGADKDNGGEGEGSQDGGEGDNEVFGGPEAAPVVTLQVVPKVTGEETEETMFTGEGHGGWGWGRGGLKTRIRYPRPDKHRNCLAGDSPHLPSYSPCPLPPPPAADGALFEFDAAAKSWHERGRGEFRVNRDPASGAGRAVMRERASKRLILNARLYAAMPTSRMAPPQKGVTFAAVNVAPAHQAGDAAPAAGAAAAGDDGAAARAAAPDQAAMQTYALRLKGADTVDALLGVIESWKTAAKAAAARGGDAAAAAGEAAV